MTYLRGGIGGLSRVGEIQVGDGPIALAAGDFDGDGFLDVVAANADSNNVTYLRQRFLMSHVNERLDVVAFSEDVLNLSDPRNPPRYGLTLSQGSLALPAQVCMVPGPHLELPQGDFWPGRFLLVVADPVTILPEAMELAEPALLKLRLRQQDLEVDPARLHVFRWDPESAKAVEFSAGKPEILNDKAGKWAAFPISRFGTYLVALESDR